MNIRRLILLYLTLHLSVIAANGQKRERIDEMDSLFKLLGSVKDSREQFAANLTLAKKILNGHQSLKYAQKALELAKEFDDKLLMADSYVEVGNDFIRINDFAHASEAILKAAKLYEQKRYDKGYGSALNMLGQLYFSNGDYSKSIMYFNKAIELHLSKSDKLQLADDYNNMGEVYRVKGKYDSALYFFKSALGLYQDLNYKTGMAYAIGNIGLVFAAEGDEQLADGQLKKATDILEDQKDYYPISIYHIEMAKLNLEKGKKEKARVLALEGYKMAEKEDLKEQMRDAAFVLHNIFVESQDYKKALEYLTLYNSNNDSIFNEATIQKIAALQTEYDVSRKEDQLTKLTIENRRNLKIAFILGLGLTIITILFFKLLLLHRKLKVANISREEQSRQLEVQKTLIEESLNKKEILLKEIHHRVKNNLQIISSLLNLQSNTLRSDDMIQVFQTGQSRIQSIALIHQKLYQSEEFTVINIQEYIEQLSSKIVDTLFNPEVQIIVRIKAERIVLDIDTAIPLGLIINELFTNSIKYAFTGMSKGTIDVKITESSDDGYVLHYSDSGTGLPGEMKVECCSTLGFKLVNILTRQLGGRVNQYNEHGAHFNIQFYDFVRRKELV